MKRNKLFILGAALSLVLAGCGNNNKRLEQKPLKTAPDPISISSDDVVSSSGYGKYENTNWIITHGGNNKSIGTNSNKRSGCTLANYSKYAVAPVTTSSIASAFVSKVSFENVVSINYTYNGGSGQASTNVYAIYSSDNSSYSQISLTNNGVQGSSIESDTTFTFGKATGYFGLLFEATNSSGNWRIDDVVLTLTFDEGIEVPPSDTCTVTFNTNGGNAIDPIDIEKDSSFGNTLPIPTKDNNTSDQVRFEFVGWYTDPLFAYDKRFDGNTQVGEDITVYACWNEIHYYVIHFHTNGAPAKEDLIVDDDTLPSDYSELALNWDGYKCIGLYTNSNCADGTEFDSNSYLTQNVDVYAKWTKADALDDYRLGMVSYNGGKYRLIGEVTAITDSDKFFIQDGNSVMFINDSKFTSNLHVGNTVDLFGTYYNSGAVFAFNNLVYCDVISDDTVLSQTPLTSVDSATHTNNMKCIDFDGLKLTSGFTADGDTGAFIANFENNYKNIIYVANPDYVNNGNFNIEEYAAGDYVRVKGAVYRQKRNNENVTTYCITSIEKRTPFDVTFVLDENNASDSFVKVAMEGKTISRPQDPAPRKDENYNYTFVDWYLDLNDSEPYNFENTIDSELTLYAKWEATPRTAKDVVQEDLVSRGFLSYKYEKTEADGPISHTLNNANTIGENTKNYGDWTLNDVPSGIAYSGQSAGDHESIQLRSNNSNSGIVVTTNANGVTASSITVSWNDNTANERKLDIYGKNAAYTNPTDLYNADDNVKGTKLGSMINDSTKEEPTKFDIEGSYSYIGIRSNSGAHYIDSIVIEWGDGSTATYTYSDISIRFSGFISVSLWNRLASENTVTGYGIMYAETDYLKGDLLSEKTPDGVNVKRFDTTLSETKPHPTLANDRQKGDLTGDYYIWNLKKNIADTDLTKSYTAVAFIVVNGETVFLDQISYSAKSLAAEYLATGFYPETQDEGALFNLAHLPETQQQEENE